MLFACDLRVVFRIFQQKADCPEDFIHKASEGFGGRKFACCLRAVCVLNFWRLRVFFRVFFRVGE